MSFRRLAILALALAALPLAGRAQGKLELTPYVGYQVNTDVHGQNGATLVTSDTMVYGVSLGTQMAPGTHAMLLWLYSNPEMQLTGLTTSSKFNVASHYFQLGGEKGVMVNPALEVFGGGTIGAALFVPQSPQVNGSTLLLEDTWRFAFTLAAGLRYHLSPSVALGGQVRLAAPVYFSEGGMYVGTGGAGIGVSGGIPIWQWNFLAGLTISP